MQYQTLLASALVANSLVTGNAYAQALPDPNAVAIQTPSTRAAQVTQTNPVSNQRIVMSIGGSQFEISLYDNPAAHALFESLPQTLSLSRWGDGEYYGRIKAQIPSSGAKHEYFDRGEVALWPEGNALCVFFDRTPVSTDERPRMDSPGVSFGRITKGDVADFRTMGGTISAVLRRER